MQSVQLLFSLILKAITTYSVTNMFCLFLVNIHTLDVIFWFLFISRTLFIISFLRKKLFKMEDIIRIQQWEMEDCLLSKATKGALNNDACILEVTLV